MIALALYLINKQYLDVFFFCFNFVSTQREDLSTAAAAAAAATTALLKAQQQVAVERASQRQAVVQRDDNPALPSPPRPQRIALVGDFKNIVNTCF